MTTPGGTGQRASQHAASFRCAACGEIAAVVKAVPAGCLVDMGPPLGPQSQSQDGIVVDYFGGTAWIAADAAAFEAVREILSGEAPDPATLRKAGWELAPFYFPDCGLNYCRADWDTRVLFGEGFYDCTRGRCPQGHEHLLDD